MQLGVNLKENPNAGYAEYDNSPLPPGDYEVIISRARIADYVAGCQSLKPEKINDYLARNPTAVADGKCLAFEATVLSGDYKGRKLFYGSWDFPVIPASDNHLPKKPGAKKFDKSAMAQNNIAGLQRRLGVVSLTFDTVHDLDNRTGVFTVTTYTGDDNTIRNSTKWSLSKPANPGETGVKKVSHTSVGTAPVVSDDEPPF